MRIGLAGGVIAVLVIIAIIVGYGTLFTVSQTQQALVVRLGKPVRVITDPGLNVKVPFIDSVIYVDKRILNIESPAQEITLSSQDNSSTSGVGEKLVVDAFARYRITDPLKYYQTVGVSGADAQLSVLLNSALRSVLGPATLTDVVRDRRDELMVKMRNQIDIRSKPYGVEVIDVRIRRADLPPKNSQAVYQRMQTERQREAAEFRAQGSQKSQEIRAKADRDVTVLLAEANSRAEQIRGEGDSERNRIFADAYNRDQDFFSFYRSMQAYDKSMQRGDTRLVLKPDTDFFRYFSNPSGQPPPGAAANSPAPTPSALANAASAGLSISRIRSDVRFLGRDRPVLRDRRDSVRGLPARHQTRDGRSPRHAGQPPADHGPCFGNRGRHYRLAGTTLIRRPRGG